MRSYSPPCPLGALLVLGVTTSVNTLHKIIPKISVPHCEVTMFIQQICNAVVEIFVLIMEAQVRKSPEANFLL